MLCHVMLCNSVQHAAKSGNTIGGFLVCFGEEEGTFLGWLVACAKSIRCTEQAKLANFNLANFLVEIVLPWY